eukprot:13048200-Alexandrium_andersonii.AAC.1
MASQLRGPCCTEPPLSSGRTRAQGGQQRAPAYGSKEDKRGKPARALGARLRRHAHGSGRDACGGPVPT